jgi:ABC-type bacteriocin/lantibiotic exporter with double-glycine peptidase domain
MLLISRIRALIDIHAKRRLAMLGGLFLINSFFEAFSLALLFALFKLIIDPTALADIPFSEYVTSWSGLERGHSFIGILCVLLFLLFLAKSVLFLAGAWIRSDIEWAIRQDVSMQLFDGYLRSPYILHLQRQSSDLYSNVHMAVGYLCSSVIKICELMSDALMLLGLLIMMLYLTPEVTLVASCVFGIIGFVYVIGADKHFQNWGQIQKDTARRVFHTVSEALLGIKQIKTLGVESFFSETYREQMQLAKWAGVRNTFYGQLLKPVLEVLIVGGLLGAVGFMLLTDQQPTQIVPVLALLGATAYRVMPATTRVVASIQMLQYARPSIEAVYQDVMAFRDGRLPLLVSSEKQQYRLQDSIRLENVSAQYDEAREPVLRNISFKIGKNEAIGLVGRSGSGKTTLADIILGLLTPSQGSVWVDGRRMMPGEAILPGLFGYVPQETFLVDASVRRNIALGELDDDVDDARLLSCLRAVSLEGVVSNLPDGIDTMIGERGLRLSGGQRQRLAIARALYRGPDVLLFDEATSALDTVTEAEVSEAIIQLHGQKTLIIIAHRLSTLRHCDRLLFLESGRLIDDGSFAELLQRNAKFREMVHQMETAADNSVPAMSAAL